MVWGGCLLHLDFWLYQAHLLEKTAFPHLIFLARLSEQTSFNSLTECRLTATMTWPMGRLVSTQPWETLQGPLMSCLCLIKPFILWGGSRVGSGLGEDPWEGSWLEWMVSCRPWHDYTFMPGKDTLGDQGMPHHAWRAPTGGLLQSRFLIAPHYPPQAGHS